jgi:cysteine sulfinate desulfinase/cysteine desulfurase-like protein
MPVQKDGWLISKTEARYDDKTILVTIMAANNEIGGAAAREWQDLSRARRHFHTDAVRRHR